ncbi:MAG: DUF4307 domain-containing protein [Actinomycetes bacterium]
MEELPNQIAERYGRGPSQNARNRIGVVITATVLGLLFAIWMIWVTITGANQLSPKTTAYELLSSGKVNVTFTVLKPADKTVICALKALKQDYGIVGYKEVTLPGNSSQDSTAVEVAQTVTFSTTEQAVTGLVDRCWFN